MARSVRVEMVLDTLRAVKGAKDLAKATDDVADSFDDVATAGDRAARAADDAGDQMSDAARAAAALDRQIEELTGSLRQMAIAQTLTGENFSRQIREQETQVRRLTRNRKLFGDLGGDAGADAAAGFSAKFVQRLGPMIASMPLAPHMLVAAGAAALAAAPLVASTLAGAVVGGAGIGGVLGGVLLATRNERVKQAGKELGQAILGDLEQRSVSFVPATLSGIQRIRQGWSSLGPDLDRIFDSSRFVEPLVDSAVKGARGFINGFADAVENADPVVDALRYSLEEIGVVTGDTFRLLSGDAKQGASAINDLTMAVSNFVTVTGQILHAGAQIKGFTDRVDEAVDRTRYWLEEHGRFLDLTADGFRQGSAEAEAYKKATIGTATALDFATLKQAGMTDAQIAAADASGTYRAELERLRSDTYKAAEANGALMASEDRVKEKQTELTRAQQDYTRTLDTMGPAAGRAAMLVDGLRKATENLFGAQIRATDANEAYEASWDDLSTSVKKNKGTLDIHTAAGRSNRDALQQLLTRTNELYFAEIATGTSVEKATKKHWNRVDAIKEEARRLGLNKTETQRLIDTYGKIPKKKETDLVLDGMKKVVDALNELYIYQRALAEGIPVQSVRGLLTAKAGPQKRQGGYHTGGYTGEGDKYEPAGIVHRKEFVMRSEATGQLKRKYPGLLEEMNATGQLPGYAAGGTVAPVDTSRRWPFATNTRVTDIPSRKEVASKVMPRFGAWPSSPAAAAAHGDSGVWRSIVALIKSTGPLSGHFGNAYRPGDRLWHASGHAVDWMGYNQDALARFLAARRPLELIHRTRNRDYAYTRGVNKGSFNEALMNAHRNHVHIAMANGGLIREPVYGYGLRSGASYSFGERGVERVTPGAGSGNITVQLVNRGVIGSRMELDNWLASGVDRLKQQGRL